MSSATVGYFSLESEFSTGKFFCGFSVVVANLRRGLEGVLVACVKVNLNNSSLLVEDSFQLSWTLFSPSFEPPVINP